tara:strand:+ start:10661 stop:11920 length:1260 start_codon:yes stop_codon:yes gene_type:complete
LLASCAPVNNLSKESSNKVENTPQEKISNQDYKKNTKAIFQKKPKDINTNEEYPNENFSKEITILLSKKDNKQIVNQFINVVELAVYKKKIKNISFSIFYYDNKNSLENFLKGEDLSGKLFIGPLNSDDTKLLNKYCSKNPIFFSFSPNTNLAKDCVFLVNFFPENEMNTIFNFFPNNSKVAFLYPENEYGFGINSIIDKVANQSNSVIVNRASYNIDLSNAAQAIKELGKYDLRKYELNRQKKILASKKDNESKKRLIKLEKFQTTKDFDFTHIIIADYGLRLLQVAPLLPYYDIDPNVVGFVGTGAWDDKVFYDEPSLNKAIYPGIEYQNRKELFESYNELYKQRLLRISTLPYDLVGLLSYIIENNYNISSFYEMINEKKVKFYGVDGNFYFLKNKIERDLQVLQISDGEAKPLLK